MTAQRIFAGLLSLLLLAMFGWSIAQGVGDEKTRVLLAIGGLLGIIYTILGRLPGSVMKYSGGVLVDDNDPNNISPRVYLAVIGSAILLAVIAMSAANFVLR